jgi:uncharacterized protein
MSTGLLALLDDIAGIAKLAAASVDDVLGQAGRAGIKAAGVVVDDAAVTPRYVVGFAPGRELPIVGRIALGSLRNKLLYLLPAALLLSAFAPWAITPLLILGGAYLCYEGAEKVYEALFPHKAHDHEKAVLRAADARSLEDQKVRGAIRTDFILSAEIMAITLAALPESPIIFQAAVLALVGSAITAVVYGAVALIVKADDAGVALATGPGPPLLQSTGRAVVTGMPHFLRALTVVGTAAMIWVGGGIIVHGIEAYGLSWPAHLIHDAAAWTGHLLPGVSPMVEWVVTAALSGLFGLVAGLLLIPFAQYLLGPAVGAAGSMFGRRG